MALRCGKLLSYGAWIAVVISAAGLIVMAVIDQPAANAVPDAARGQLSDGLTAAIAEPRIEVEQAVDIGDLPAGQSALVRLPVTNVGSAPLVIESASKNCSCTMPTGLPLTIEPGTTEVLEVGYESRITPEPYDIGLRIELHTNDPGRQTVPVFFTGKCLPTIYWSEKRLFMGKVRRQTSRRSVLRIHEYRPELLPRPLELSEVTFEGDPGFRFVQAVRWAEHDAGGLDLIFEFEAGDRDGKYHTNASVRLNIADRFVIPLPIVAEVSNAISAEPCILVWQAGQSQPIEVQIHGLTAEQATELVLTSSSPLVTWEIITPAEHGTGPLVRFFKSEQAAAAKGISRGTVSLCTAHEDGGHLEIPYLVIP